MFVCLFCFVFVFHIYFILSLIILDHDLTKNFDFVSGLEWNDPLHVNSLSDFEYRQLCILLTKIAHTVRLRDIVLMPYFQDYELVILIE